MRSLMCQYQLPFVFTIANLEIDWYNYLRSPGANEHWCNDGATSPQSIGISSHLPQRSDEPPLPP
jgi:hypothetical protein